MGVTGGARGSVHGAPSMDRNRLMNLIDGWGDNPGWEKRFWPAGACGRPLCWTVQGVHRGYLEKLAQN